MRNRACEVVTLNFDTFKEIHEKAIKVDYLQKYILRNKWISREEIANILKIELPEEED